MGRSCAKMKAYLAIVCVLLGGCATRSWETPRGTMFAEIRRMESAFAGTEKGWTGFAFYIEENDGIAGPRLTGYRYKGGHLVDVIGGSSLSASTVAALRAVELRPFDFAAEVSRVQAEIRKEFEARKPGYVYMFPAVVDGAEYEIEIATSAGPFWLKRWNPGFDIDYYAEHSPDIAKVRRVLEILSSYYGRLEFGV